MTCQSEEHEEVHCHKVGEIAMKSEAFSFKSLHKRKGASGSVLQISGHAPIAGLRSDVQLIPETLAPSTRKQQTRVKHFSVLSG